MSCLAREGKDATACPVSGTPYNIPVHICPVCNLYDSARLISGTEVIEEIPVLCRGKMT